MSDISRTLGRMRRMDDLALLSSPVHRLHPLSKLLTTVVYIMTVVSFHKYDLSGIAVMTLYPAFMSALSGISLRACLDRMRFVMPLVCFVGIFNPFFDRTIFFRLGSFAVTGGMISMITLMLKGVLCLMASFLLAATTSIDSLCRCLRQLHVPDMIVSLFLLTFRYIFVLTEEVSVMTQAYSLRAPGQRGIHISAWGSFVGQLLLRSMDRAKELYESMLLRGFTGDLLYAAPCRMRWKDLLFPAVMCAAFAVGRLGRISYLLGSLFV